MPAPVRDLAERFWRHLFGMRGLGRKIDENVALVILHLAKNTTLSQARIGGLFGLGQQAVGLIAAGKRWKHLRLDDLRLHAGS